MESSLYFAILNNNILCHEDRKYRMARCILSTEGMAGWGKKVKFCLRYGYYHVNRIQNENGGGSHISAVVLLARSG